MTLLFRHSAAKFVPFLKHRLHLSIIFCWICLTRGTSFAMLLLFVTSSKKISSFGMKWIRRGWPRLRLVNYSVHGNTERESTLTKPSLGNICFIGPVLRRRHLNSLKSFLIIDLNYSSNFGSFSGRTTNFLSLKWSFRAVFTVYKLSEFRIKAY